MLVVHEARTPDISEMVDSTLEISMFFDEILCIGQQNIRLIVLDVHNVGLIFILCRVIKLLILFVFIFFPFINSD